MKNQTTDTAKRIFIVEDDKFYLEILKNQVGFLDNVEVHAFESAESCISNIDLKPDVILLDFYLDGSNKNNISGHEALSILKGINPEQKILFISGEQNWELMETYNKYRAVKYILKDEFLNTQLNPTIKNLMIL